MTTVVLDTGALIALENFGNRRAFVLVEQLNASGAGFLVPSAVLAQAWRGGTGRQIPWTLLLKRPNFSVVDLTLAVAKQIGDLCAETAMSDVVDAFVVVLARNTQADHVLTSDPGDLTKLDPRIPVVAV